MCTSPKLDVAMWVPKLRSRHMSNGRGGVSDKQDCDKTDDLFRPCLVLKKV